MDRHQALRNYDWRSLQLRVRQWYDARGLRFVEQPLANIDHNFGTDYCVPRTNTLVIKLRRDAATTFVIAVTPAAQRADLTVIRRMYRASTAWIATMGEVQYLTHSVPGCVPAFGSLFGLPVLVDARLSTASEIFAASGRPGFAVRIPMRVYSMSENPHLLGFCRESVTARHFENLGDLALETVV